MGDALPAVLTEKDWTNPENEADCEPYTQSKTIAERAAWDYVAGEGQGMTSAASPRRRRCGSCSAAI